MAGYKLRDVSVEFPIYNSQQQSLRATLLEMTAGGLIRHDVKNRPVVEALNGINLDIKDGDRLGLIGRNGSGKTTLLTVLSGLCQPTAGEIEIHGKTHALFSVGGDMEAELSGYENIYLLGMLAGLSKAEINVLIPDIEEFTELGAFLNMPIRTYSAGMQMRLGFAMATVANPEILLMDEAIGAGDAGFVQKATKRAQGLFDRANIMVMTSHSPDLVKALCNRAVLLDHGHIVADGPVDEILEIYDGGKGNYSPAHFAAKVEETRIHTLSVVVMCNNQEEELREAFRSLWNQADFVTELIVINNGNDEGSERFILDEQGKWENFVYIKNAEEKEFIENISVGLESATQECVYFFNVQDVLLPGFFAKSMKLMSSNEDAGVCSTLSLVSDYRGENIRRLKSPVVRIEPSYLSAKEVRSAIYGIDNWFLENTVIFRRNYLLTMLPINNDLKGYTLNYFSWVLALEHGACFLPYSLALRRRYQVWSSAEVFNDERLAREVWEKFKDALSSRLPDKIDKKFLWRVRRRWFFNVQSAKVQQKSAEILKALTENMPRGLFRRGVNRLLGLGLRLMAFMTRVMLMLYYKPFDVINVVKRRLQQAIH